MNSSGVSQNRIPLWVMVKSNSVLAGLLCLGMFFLSGCVVQKEVDKADDSVLTAPIVDAKLSEDDFGFPSAPPSLARGKEVFEASCKQCHTPESWQNPKVQTDLTYTTPIDYFLMLSRGESPQVAYPSDERKPLLPKIHANPATNEKLVYRSMSRDDRWAVLFYTRHLAGFDDIDFNNRAGKKMDLFADVYGGNCAVCHGGTGNAEGFLHTGKPSKHGPEGGKVHIGLFQPPPANFHDYKRFYNRTDAQIQKYIAEGVYPSAMPRWYGRVDKDKDYVYNDELILKLVRLLRRKFQVNYDLPIDEKAPPGLQIRTGIAATFKPQTSMDIDNVDADQPIHVIPPAIEKEEAEQTALPPAQAAKPHQAKASQAKPAHRNHQVRKPVQQENQSPVEAGETQP